MLKLIIILKLIVISFIFSNAAYAAGAAGTISVRNSTDMTLRVTYSGLGCDAIGFGMGWVCGYGILKPDQISHWDYGWGVTTTWINIGDDATPDSLHPCDDASIYYDKYCYLDHKVVSTNARKTDNCVFTKKSIRHYDLTCARQ